MLVSEELQSDPNCMPRIAFVLMALLHFRRFKFARWCTVRVVAASLMASVVIGLRALVGMTRADRSTSDYHLHGFERFTPVVAGFMARATIIGSLTDTLLAECLADDRVARNLAKLEETVKTELSWAANLPPIVWSRLSMACNSDPSPARLRVECLDGMHTAAAHIEKQVFRRARTYPHKLAVGNIEQNLKDLEASGEPTQHDLTTWKI